MPGPMARCYEALANNPFPRFGTDRHHLLRGTRHRRGGGVFWEYEVSGGERVRYKKGPEGDPTVVYAGPHPADT